MPDDPSRISASAALRRLKSGELTVERLARACLARIETRDPEVRAWTHLDSAWVLAQARELDRCGPGGPLHGLPVGMKDVIYTKDMPTQHNSPLYYGDHPRLDAACVALLRQAGALIFGKTDTVEFAATGRRALTRNPHDLARTPGGSSSGSAAAVADFHVPLALGTQTGGSTLRPASYCGVFGFKPTWNLVSNEGCKTYAQSLDTLGWFARTAEDLSLLHSVFDPDYEADAPPLRLAGARIALCRTPMWDKALPETRRALDTAAERLRGAGARVQPLELPPSFAELPRLQLLVMRAEGRSAFLPDYRTFGARLHPSLREQVENVDGYTRAELRAAYDTAALHRITFDRIAGDYDAVLAPSTPGEAPLGLAETGPLVFNGLWTLLHVPCVNVPGLSSPAGLPIGVTVTGPRFSDSAVLAAAAALEPLLAGQER